MEEMAVPLIPVLADSGSRPGRGGIVGDGMIAEYLAFGAVGAVIGGSVMDVIPMAKLRTPVWATGIVPAYDQLRMASWGRPVEIGPLKVADGDILMADQGGVIRIPRDAVQVVLDGMAAFRELERSIAEISRRPGLTAKQLRAWYAEFEPEFLGDESSTWANSSTAIPRVVAAARSRRSNVRNRRGLAAARRPPGGSHRVSADPREQPSTDARARQASSTATTVKRPQSWVSAFWYVAR